MKMAFSGHRPEGLPFAWNSPAFHRLEAALREALLARVRADYDTFYCGMAQGMDILFGNIVLSLKQNERPNLKLICVLPYRNHARSWNPFWREQHDTILAEASEIIQTGETYRPGCYHMRNRIMVDHCDTLMAVYSGITTGGTAYTVRYAQKQGTPVLILNPNQFLK